MILLKVEPLWSEEETSENLKFAHTEIMFVVFWFVSLFFWLKGRNNKRVSAFSICSIPCHIDPGQIGDQNAVAFVSLLLFYARVSFS